MPNLTNPNEKQRKRMQLSTDDDATSNTDNDTGRNNQNTRSAKHNGTPKKSSEKHKHVTSTHKKSNQIFNALNDEDDDTDEDVAVQINKNNNNSNSATVKIIIGVCAVVIVSVFGIIFLTSNNKSKSKQEISEVTTQQQQQPNQSSQHKPQQNTTPKEDKVVEDERLGIQDFTTNTTMTTDSILGDGKNVTSDLFGLTTRVDYTVSDVYYTTDFVNYTKRRATWGGGLELYYLDCEYRGSKYMVQVPFKYYKELDDTGIVTVKMEVLRIKGATDSDTRSVISFMELDEEVLRTVQKSKSNRKY